MTKAYFYQTSAKSLEPLLCDLAMGWNKEGKRTLILAEDPQHAQRLDQMLWTWRQESFVPHLSLDRLEDRDRPLAQKARTLIASDPNVSHAMDCLLLAAPKPLDGFDRFAEIVDFVIEDDEIRKAEARKRFVAYREAGFDPQLIVHEGR